MYYSILFVYTFYSLYKFISWFLLSRQAESFLFHPHRGEDRNRAMRARFNLIYRSGQDRIERARSIDLRDQRADENRVEATKEEEEEEEGPWR